MFINIWHFPSETSKIIKFVEKQGNVSKEKPENAQEQQEKCYDIGFDSLFHLDLEGANPLFDYPNTEENQHLKALSIWGFHS